MNKQNLVNLIILIIVFFIFIAMIIQLFPLLEDVIKDREDEAGLVEVVDALGWRGPLSLIGLAALQVVFPIVPAVAIGILTGLTYGVFWGMAIFLGGIAIGNIFVIFAMRKLTVIFANRKNKKPKEDKKEHSGLLSKENLEKINKPEVVAFFLFMIPFISGAGPYLFAGTKANIWKYTAAVVAGSIPTAILYVFLGDRISQGSHLTAIITGATLVVALVFILIFRKKILSMIIK